MSTEANNPNAESQQHDAFLMQRVQHSKEDLGEHFPIVIVIGAIRNENGDVQHYTAANGCLFDLRGLLQDVLGMVNADYQHGNKTLRIDPRRASEGK